MRPLPSARAVVDFCKQNNGGCAKVARCSQKGTKVSCSCLKGYKGDGRSCTEIDPCADGLNGGCHEHATCKMTGPVSLSSPWGTWEHFPALLSLASLCLPFGLLLSFLPTGLYVSLSLQMKCQVAS